MVCKIKFGDPLLDKYRGVENLKEARELIFKRINALFKYYLKGHEEDIPSEISPGIIFVIKQLAELAEIPGFIDSKTVSKAGQPSRWNGEDGFILSAKVQVLLLKHPEYSERKAIMQVTRKIFADSTVDEGVYRRYKEGLKDRWAYIYKVKYTVDHIKQLNHYDEINEERKQTIIEFIKRHLNQLYEKQFEKEQKLFKENPKIPIYVKDLDHPIQVERFVFD